MEEIKNKWWHWADRERDPILWAVLRHRAHAIYPEFKKITGNAVNCLFVWQNGTISIYYRKADLERLTKFMLMNFKKDNRLIAKIKKEHYRRAKALLKSSARIYKADLKRESNQVLLSFLFEFQKLYLNLATYTTFPVFVTYQLEEMIRRYLLKQCKKGGEEDNCNQYFTTLTSTKQKSWVRIREDDLNRVIAKIKKTKELVPVFVKKKLSSIRQLLQKKYLKINSEIEQHHKRYQWIPFEFIGPALILNDVLSEIKIQLKQNKGTKEEKTGPKKLNKMALMKKLRIDFQNIHLIKALAELIFLKEYRHGIYNRVQFEFAPFLKEVVRRFGLHLDQIYYLNFSEIENLFKGKEINRAEINRRLSFSLWVTGNFKEKIIIGRKAKKLLEKEIRHNKRVVTLEKEFEGNIANPGRARGIVRILKDATEINKIKQGDILVANMTTADYLPAMRKAAAFITNEGGITCHAAIVSREMKKPCVIGTKIATKVLKDGDLVEVDANKGIVKIIK